MALIEDSSLEKWKNDQSPNRDTDRLFGAYDRFVGTPLHQKIRTDFIVIPAILSVEEALSVISRSESGAVVVIRCLINGSSFYYLRTSSALTRKLQGKNYGDILEVALSPGEAKYADVVNQAAAKRQLQKETVDSRPTVVVDDGKVVGYFGFTPQLLEGAPAKRGLPKVKHRRGPSQVTFDYADLLKEKSVKLGSTGAEPTLGHGDDAGPSLKGYGDEVETGTKGFAFRRSASPSWERDDDEVESSGKPTAKGSDTAAPETLPICPQGSSASCHFAAQMAEEVLLGSVQQVQATLSMEKIAIAAGDAAQMGSATVEGRITIRLIPKRNFVVIGDSRVEVQLPAPGEPSVDLFFDVKPTFAGEGELWVVFFQGPLSLVTLKLKPEIVTTMTAGAETPIAATSTVAPQLSEPMRLNVMYVDREESGNKIRYRYWLTLNDAHIDNEYESPELDKDIVTILKPYMDLFDAVETDSKTDFDQLQLQLRSIGAQLFRKLFPSDLQKVFWENRNRISHLRFYCDEPYIPWEIFHVCEPGKPLGPETCFFGQMGLIRWLRGNSAPTNLRIRPGRAKYLTPFYPDKELPNTKKEGALLEELFGATPVAPATRPETTKLLQQKGPFDLFHFAGHGQASEEQSTDARIELEPATPDADRRLRDITPELIAGICDFETEDGTRPIVVLNSCQAGKLGRYVTGLSGFVTAFLERKAGLFVGALWMIGDEPAFTFIESFYKALKNGKCVSEAVMAGRENARSEGDATYLSYVVYGDPFARLAP